MKLVKGIGENEHLIAIGWDSRCCGYGSQETSEALPSPLPPTDLISLMMEGPDVASVDSTAMQSVTLSDYARRSTLSESWSRLSEQIFRVDKWSFHRGYAARRIGSGLK